MTLRIKMIKGDGSALRIKVIIFIILVVETITRGKNLSLLIHRAVVKETFVVKVDTNATIFHHNSPDNTFGKAMEGLNWTKFESSLDDDVALTNFAREVFYLAFSFTIMEPKTPINVTCQAPELLIPLPQENTDGQDSSASSFCSPLASQVFNGILRPTPRKVAHAIQLGFDIDTLEIMLRELIDVVDKFFIIEWTMPHNQNLNPKPLAWEAVKGDARFAFTWGKIVHIVMDDIDTVYTTTGDMWSVEGLQEHKRVDLIMEWNNQTKFFTEDDLIGFGDTDEIPSRSNVQMLKHCEWRNDSPVDVGIWFPMGRINQAFRTDHPIAGHPYTLGDPTYYIWGKVPKHASRNRGKSPNWILGGVHFSHYGYLVYQVMKLLSCSECGEFMKSVLSMLHATVKTGNWKELEYNVSQSEGWGGRMIPLDQLDPLERSKIVYLPWFYDCNRNRYSMWEGHPDSRVS